MIKNVKPIDDTWAVYRHKETYILDDYGYAVSFEVEATVFETGDAHAVVDGEIEELYFPEETCLDIVVDAVWDRVFEITREKYEEENN